MQRQKPDAWDSCARDSFLRFRSRHIIFLPLSLSVIEPGGGCLSRSAEEGAGSPLRSVPRRCVPAVADVNKQRQRFILACIYLNNL